MGTVARLRHTTHRAHQTVTTFDNPVELLSAAARSRLLRRPSGLVFRVNGVAVVAPASRGAVFPVYEVFAEDTYRLAWFSRGLGESPVALDIGAHVGSFSLAFASLFQHARVDAYEASATTAAYLQRSIDASGRSSRVRCHAEALSATEGFVDFTDDDTCSPLNTVTDRYDGARSRVPSVTLATAFERLGGHVDLVKIDAEGVEYDLVLRSTPELWSGVRRVVLEYHEVPGHGQDELVGFFAGVGLEPVAHEPMLGNPREGLMWFARPPFDPEGGTLLR